MSNSDRLARFRKLNRKVDAPAPETNAAVPEPETDGSDNAPVTADAAQTAADPAPVPVNREKIGWVSPSYSVSRAVTLCPDKVAARRCVAFSQDTAAIDAYKVLRTQILQRTKKSGGRTIMVTSARHGEGKTTTAINLSFTFAREFLQTVLLVDCDLQHQDVHRYLCYDNDHGLIDYLLDDKPVSELITWPGIEKLTVISGGRTIEESSELLGSPRMRDLVADMKSRYPERYVIFDVPGLLSSADALVFAPLVDHILVVVQEGQTSLPEIQRAVATLPADKVLGLMLNRHKGSHIVTDPRRRSNA